MIRPKYKHGKCTEGYDACGCDSYNEHNAKALDHIIRQLDYLIEIQIRTYENEYDKYLED